MSHVVFVQLGAEVPTYLSLAVAQAARFTEAPVRVLVNAATADTLRRNLGSNADVVMVEDLPVSTEHRIFREACPFDRSKRNGFWYFTTERFFYLAAFAAAAGLNDVVHLESDVMLYADLARLVPALRQSYAGLAAPFDNDDRCVPAFVYAHSGEALNVLTRFISKSLTERPGDFSSDMQLLAIARHLLGSNCLDALPIDPIFSTVPLASRSGLLPRDPGLYRRHAETLGVLFDAAAIGQFLGGADPRNYRRRRGARRLIDLVPALRLSMGVGFINESSLLDPSRFQYVWIKDALGRSIPHIVSGDEGMPIANLHIHSKRLELFAK